VQDPRRVRGLSWLVPKSQQRASFSLSLSPTVKTQGCSSRTLTRPSPRARRVRRSGRRPQRRNDHLPHLGPPRPPPSSSSRPRGGQVRPADLGRPRRVLLDAPARDRHARELAVGVGRRQDPRLARRAHDREGPGRRQARRIRDGARERLDAARLLPARSVSPSPQPLTSLSRSSEADDEAQCARSGPHGQGHHRRRRPRDVAAPLARLCPLPHHHDGASSRHTTLSLP